MNKEERQERHRLRLKLKKEREEKAAEYRSYYWRFHEETMCLLRELPERSCKHSHSVTLLHLPSFEDHVHCRIEWNDDSAICTIKTWKYETDYSYFMEMPQGPDDPRLPQDYWRDIKPTFKEDQIFLPVSSITELIDLVKGLRLSILTPIPTYICCDGESFELTFTHGDAISQWKWHCEPPEPWKELEKIVAVIKKLVTPNS